jgi:3-oxoadipate enol-lactonase
MRSAVRGWMSDMQWQQPGEPVLGRLSEIRIPTVIMVGDKDNPALIASNEEAARRIQGCELISVPGVDHYPTVRVPELVLDAILGIAPVVAARRAGEINDIKEHPQSGSTVNQGAP